MYNHIFLILVICLIKISLIFSNNEFDLLIDGSSSTNDLKPFWKSTGFCPPDPRSKVSEYLLSDDVKMNLALISSLPNAAIKYVRIHWLLDTITIISLSHNSLPVYNFTNLDGIIDWLYSNNLYPGFELMGNPSSYFNDFLQPNQIDSWKYLIRDIVTRYLDKYGTNYVSEWRFETWNEPDLRGYNILNFTLPGYMQYVTACSDGLCEASQGRKQNSFKLGGPAGLFKSPDKHPLCWGLISECNKSLYYCPLHFISFHKKGDGTASGVLNKGLKLVNYIHKQFPNLKNISISNDEADILTGWSKSKEWRADVRYAAMVTKVIIDHYKKFINEMNINIELLSNDNGFLNYHPYYFTQRTLLTRFQMNNTQPPHTQFIKKPVYVTMALLSYLGTKVLNNVETDKNDDLVSYLVTSDTAGLEFSVLLAYVNDTEQDVNLIKTFEIVMKYLPKDKYRYVVYQCDNNSTNPYLIWKFSGAPVFPDKNTRSEMRRNEGPRRIMGPISVLTDADLHIKFTAMLPSVTLVHICAARDHSPGPVTKLQVFNITFNEVQIMWKDHHVGTKCIRRYEIEFRPDVIGNEIDNQLFKRINYNDDIFVSYQYVAKGVPEGTIGMYRVRAVDYWNRPGPYTTPVKFP